MKTVIFNKSVLIPKKGICSIGTELPCDDEYAKHLVENIKCADYLETEENPSEMSENSATETQVIEVIKVLDQDNEQLWTADGKPKIEVLEDVLDKKVTAKQRDDAYIIFKQNKG